MNKTTLSIAIAGSFLAFPEAALGQVEAQSIEAQLTEDVRLSRGGT